jgi:Second Messenger Oligonucleotide or Dinucleotide Synthetase domain
LTPILANWAGTQLSEIKLSGSYAKGTAVAGSTDLDVLVSLKVNTRESLKDLYNKLNRRLTSLGYATRLQNVSIGITHNGLNVDVVPAKRQSLLHTDHSIYTRKRDSWLQTNIDTHISYVRNANRADEIRGIKIWRKLHGLELSSFYLELSVINLLGRRSFLASESVSGNISRALGYLANNFETARIVDPANTNNVVSDEPTVSEKRAIATCAAQSLTRNWNQVLW